MDMNYRGGMWEGRGGQDGVEWGGECDNCNSIINKYFFLNSKTCFEFRISSSIAAKKPAGTLIGIALNL